MVALSDYTGREQSYVKHVFLERYLERLVHKTASVYPHIVYVDGFAGPWQSANEKFDDTSFGIALNALRSAKASWKGRGREVRMSAYLVERDAIAYKRLAEAPGKYPDVEIKTYGADFLSVLPSILKDIPAGAFAFFLIDPKGWHIPLKALAPMLARPKSEVIFNFMFEFINRAASMKRPPWSPGSMNCSPMATGGLRWKGRACPPRSVRPSWLKHLLPTSLILVNTSTSLKRPCCARSKIVHCIACSTQHGMRKA
jgi:three-Cys-motif partner protein